MSEKTYRACCALMRPIYAVLYPVELSGLENLPAEGGCLVCANHCSNRDPLIIAVHARSRCLRFMAKAELFRFKPLGALLRALMAFPVDRGHNDLNAVRTALKILADDHVLGLFPQGTRSRENKRLPMLNGVSMIALRAKKPVIPVYIGGPYRLFRRTPVRFGAPVDLSDFGRRMDGETLSAATRRIEDAVWGMADDPQSGR